MYPIDTHSFITFLLNGFPASIAVSDFLLKSILITVLIACLTTGLANKFASESKHLLWVSCLFTISLIPFLPSFPQALTGGNYTAQSLELILFSLPETIQPHPVVQPPAGDESRFEWGQLMIMAWGLVTALLLLKLVISIKQVLSISKGATAESKLSLVKQLNDLKRQLKITRPVVIKYTDQISSPMSFGLISPKILFPTTAKYWDSRVFESALIHELSHVRRIDWLTSILAYIVCCLAWFNPAVWYALRQINAEAENSSDNTVVVLGKDEFDYVKHLLAIAKSCNSIKHNELAAQAIASKSNLKDRVALLLGAAQRPKQSSRVFLVGLAFTSIPVLSLLGIGKVLGVYDNYSLEKSFQELYPNLIASNNEPLLLLSSIRSNSNSVAERDGFDMTFPPVFESAVINTSNIIPLPNHKNSIIDSRALTLSNPLLVSVESQSVNRELQSALKVGVSIPQFQIEGEREERFQENNPNRSLVSETQPQADVPPFISAAQFQNTGIGEDLAKIEYLSKAQIRNQISTYEDEFYTTFNRSIDKQHLRIECGGYMPSGSYIEQRYCEPRFVISARSETFRHWGFTTTSLGELGLEQEFRDLTTAMNTALSKDNYLRELNLALFLLKTRLIELS